MTQEEERLIIIDICARVPFGLVVQQSPRYPICRKKSHEADYDYITHDYEIFNCDINGRLDWKPFRSDDYIYIHDKIKGQTCKPYLRPMSSMTKEEKHDCIAFSRTCAIKGIYQLVDFTIPNPNFVDWLNKHNFDYRGLIEKGLAIKAPEGMYKL